MSNLESELLKTLDAEFRAHRTIYLLRMAESVSRLPEIDYKALPDKVKDWYDACVAAAKKRGDVPDIADFDK